MEVPYDPNVANMTWTVIDDLYRRREINYIPTSENDPLFYDVYVNVYEDFMSRDRRPGFSNGFNDRPVIREQPTFNNYGGSFGVRASTRRNAHVEPDDSFSTFGSNVSKQRREVSRDEPRFQRANEDRSETKSKNKFRPGGDIKPILRIGEKVIKKVDEDGYYYYAVALEN